MDLLLNWVLDKRSADSMLLLIEHRGIKNKIVKYMNCNLRDIAIAIIGRILTSALVNKGFWNM